VRRPGRHASNEASAGCDLKRLVAAGYDRVAEREDQVEAGFLWMVARKLAERIAG
jgi:hypothetical protein